MTVDVQREGFFCLVRSWAEGGDSRLVGKASDFARQHQKSKAVFPGLLSFDRCIDRQQVGLIRHLGNGGKSHKVGHERVNVRGKKIKGKKYGGPLPDWS
jgi:hypothetical protein